jgi:hypothetical protein
MMFKYIAPVALLIGAASVSAEEYQMFAGINADHYRFSGESDTNWGLNGTYFFGKKATLGPLEQFEYINKVSNMSASYSRLGDYNTWGIGGEYFAENGLVVSARHSRFDGEYANQLGLGYLVSNNLIVRANAFKGEDSSTEYVFSASYNHQLAGNDYIGFTAFTDDEFDYYGISSKYFASLGEGRFIAVGVAIADNDSSTSWAAVADYYFSKMTSVGMSYDKGDNYSLNTKHFFTQNWAVEAAFASNTDTSALKTYRLGVIGQF